MSMETVVLDASAGVKWFRREPGSTDALELLERLGDGTIRVVVPAVFPYEVLDVARRLFGPERARAIWDGLIEAGLLAAGSDRALVDATIGMSQLLGCTLCDAAAPALAERLGCRLISADRRAHARFAAVTLLS
jgi:predicted nucleic acid-binding protein